jgi:hypothetical protein
MIIRLSREHTINTGHYENIKVGGSVEFDTKDIEDVESVDVNLVARQSLDSLLKADLEAALAAVPEDQQTHIEFWRK